MKSHQSRINARAIRDERFEERVIAATLGIWTAVLALGIAVFLGAALAGIDQLQDVLMQADQLRGF